MAKCSLYDKSDRVEHINDFKKHVPAHKKPKKFVGWIEKYNCDNSTAVTPNRSSKLKTTQYKLDLLCHCTQQFLLE